MDHSVVHRAVKMASPPKLNERHRVHVDSVDCCNVVHTFYDFSVLAYF